MYKYVFLPLKKQTCDATNMSSLKSKQQREREKESKIMCRCGWMELPPRNISLISSSKTVSGQGHCGGLLR